MKIILILILIFIFITSLLSLYLLVLLSKKPITKVALLISGNTRTFDEAQQNISDFIHHIEKKNNAVVHVFLCLDEETDNIRLPNVKTVRYDTTNISKGDDFTYQMHRWNLCYNSISNKNQYDWFIRTRPDIHLLEYDIDLKKLAKDNLHVRYRWTNIDNLELEKCSWKDRNKCPKGPINVVDDQFFIAHASIAKQVFSIEQGKHEYEVDSIKKQEHFFTYIVASHGIHTTPLKMKINIIR